MTAWGEAQRAQPQVKVRKENPLRAVSAGHRIEMIPVFCFGPSGLGGIGGHPVTWASTRYARSSPGCNIAGFQPVIGGWKLRLAVRFKRRSATRTVSQPLFGLKPAQAHGDHHAVAPRLLKEVRCTLALGKNEMTISGYCAGTR